MKNETNSISFRVSQFLLCSLFRTKSFIKTGFYRILSHAYLEINDFSMTESYADLDLQIQFLCFLRNERLYIDRSNGLKYILPTSKLTGHLSC